LGLRAELALGGMQPTSKKSAKDHDQQKPATKVNRRRLKPELRVSRRSCRLSPLNGEDLE
jgi:hypothetical protein